MSKDRLLWLLGGALLLAIGGVYTAFTHDLSRARSLLLGRTETIPATAGTLEYAVTGIGTPILVVHGSAGGFDQSLEIAGSLIPLGFRVIAPSRFGYLQSKPLQRSITPEIQADAYMELLDHLNIDKISVVAISAGAWSGLQFAIRHPERCQALVLLVPATHLPSGVKMRGGLVTEAMVNSDFFAWTAVKLLSILPPSVVAEKMLGTPASVIRHAKPDERARVRKLLAGLLPTSARKWGMQIDVQTAADRRPMPLEKIECPVLAISAEDDEFGTALRAREIAKAVSNGKVVIYPTGGHALVGRQHTALEDSAAFLSAIDTTKH